MLERLQYCLFMYVVIEIDLAQSDSVRVLQCRQFGGNRTNSKTSINFKALARNSSDKAGASRQACLPTGSDR